MSPTAVRVLCPAKINLRLEVRGRRSDGYHEVRTLFQAIDLEDVVEAFPGKGLALETDDPGLPTGEDNLVLRAARALAAAAGVTRPGARLVLTKRIPVGGGLGGGSSDAAGTLVALSRLWSVPCDREALEEIGRGLGADVPFFLTGGTAYGWGRGDRILAMPDLGETHVLLGIPPFGISTAEVYRRHGADTLTPREAGVTVPALFHKLVEKKDFGLVGNELERSVLEGWPALRSFRDALRDNGAAAALVSGSGSTVFGLFESVRSMAGARETLTKRFSDWRVVRTRTSGHGVRPAETGCGGAAGSEG